MANDSPTVTCLCVQIHHRLHPDTAFAYSCNNFAARYTGGVWVGSFWIGQMAQMMSGDLFTYWRVLPVYLWALAMASRESSE